MLPKEDPRIRIKRLSFVVYNHADADKARQFYLDFGMAIVHQGGGSTFFGGYGPDPFVYWLRKAEPGDPSSFGGAAYEVEERAELDKAAKISGASEIQPLDAPGGGQIVTIRDPLGFVVHFVYGQQKRSAGEIDTLPSDDSDPVLGQVLKDIKSRDHVYNYEEPDQKPRKGKFLRFKPGPAPVHKFGHYGCTYPAGRHDEVYDFYTRHFALAPSDQLERDGKTIVTFFHIDRGQDFTDHHCFFIKPAKPNQSCSVAHSAFEVHDFDTQQLGHQHLTAKGYNNCWGVGRHILGSQIFDYWFDTSEFIVEHYCDGDLVNIETEVSHGPAGPDSLKIWGPPVPNVF
ncbi:hypothetical protein PHSY_002725 [Pseudozyma hubeiensis SY62]|uniref:VOC domain-containing protein n=1 Tax=Pseudozyma hubeiensis (strain SY62) TaxID=1305764 RepID=R9PAM8_PSEHS|nr:hypothetical protein PHSY_002725 [Pseudozyma hubeiensis SY62]GAC95150.1 hypothetical protein PHSY_002725 [Pseudozyma hubeiensis SY62]